MATWRVALLQSRKRRNPGPPDRAFFCGTRLDTSGTPESNAADADDTSVLDTTLRERLQGSEAAKLVFVAIVVALDEAEERPVVIGWGPALVFT